MKMTISIPTGGLAQIDRRCPEGMSRSEFLRRCALGEPIPKAHHDQAARAYRRLIFSAAMSKNCIPYVVDYVKTTAQHDQAAGISLAAELASIDFILSSFFPHIPRTSFRVAKNGQELLNL